MARKTTGKSKRPNTPTSWSGKAHPWTAAKNLGEHGGRRARLEPASGNPDDLSGGALNYDPFDASTFGISSHQMGD